MIKRLSSKVVYQNQWMTVREDKIVRESGTEGIYGIVEKPHFAIIIPKQGVQLYLVRQYRYALKHYCWEFPQGACKSNPDISPEALAKAELKEETGFSAAHWHELGEQALAPGFCSQTYHIYLAEQLTPGETQLDLEEEGLNCRGFSISEVEAMILDGEIIDSTSINAFAMARLKGYL